MVRHILSLFLEYFLMQHIKSKNSFNLKFYFEYICSIGNLSIFSRKLRFPTPSPQVVCCNWSKLSFRFISPDKTNYYLTWEKPWTRRIFSQVFTISTAGCFSGQNFEFFFSNFTKKRLNFSIFKIIL